MRDPEPFACFRKREQQLGQGDHRPRNVLVAALPAADRAAGRDAHRARETLGAEAKDTSRRLELPWRHAILAMAIDSPATPMITETSHTLRFEISALRSVTARVTSALVASCGKRYRFAASACASAV